MKRLHIAASIVIPLLMLAGVGWAIAWNYAGQDKVPEEVVTGGIPIGGLPIVKALEMLENYEKELRTRTITIEANKAASDSKSWTIEELGYTVQFEGIKLSLQKLREGSVWDRALSRLQFQKSYVLMQSWDDKALNDELLKQWDWIENNAPQNATRVIDDNDKVVYTPHVDAYRLAIGELLKEVNDWVVIKPEAVGKPVEKTFVGELPITVVHPEFTLEKLKDEGIDRKIMEFTTDFSSSAKGRVHNITVTAEMLNDWHLAPGEEFKYSELIALTKHEHEYQEAPVILNGKLVPGIGGGICQVSSTLYQAILRAGLEITERRNHSLPVAYLAVGLDATYATDAIDFRFKNTTGKHLIIRTETENGKLTVKLFGTMPENERYEIETATIKTIAAPVEERVNNSLPAGARKTVEAGKSGYVVETFRTLLRDDVVVSKERVSRDTYRAQPTIIERGPAPGTSAGEATPTPPPSGGLLEDGV